MLRLIIIALLLYGAYYVGSSIFGEYKSVQRRNGNQEVSTPAANSAPTAPVAAPLEGMAPQMQASLDAAAAQGPASFKRWLEKYRPNLRDPKLGDIELDFAVAMMRQNSIEARATYRAVKERTPENSPLQPRLKRLSKTFE